MWLQLIVIFLGLIGLVIFDSNGDNRVAKRKSYVIYLSVILILQSGLRHLAVGADTFEYFRRFKYYSTLSWGEVGESFYNAFFRGEGKDAGYDVFNKLVSCITDEYQVFLFIVAIFFFTVLCKFIYRNTSSNLQVFLALCFYQLFFYTFFSITGVRQTIAVGFTLWSYKYIEQRRILPFLFLVLIGVTFHKTALIFLPFYYVSRIRNPRTILTCAVFALPILLFGARRFAGFLANMAGDYSSYAESTYANAGGPNYLLMLLALAILSFYKYNNIRTSYGSVSFTYINALAITIMLAPLVWVDPSLLRLSYYYSIFLVALFPAVMSCFYSNGDYTSKMIVASIIIIVFSIIIIKTNSSYSFFWQEMELGSNYK